MHMAMRIALYSLIIKCFIIIATNAEKELTHFMRNYILQTSTEAITPLPKNHSALELYTNYNVSTSTKWTFSTMKKIHFRSSIARNRVEMNICGSQIQHVNENQPLLFQTPPGPSLKIYYSICSICTRLH